MIKLHNQVPQVYSKASRDFQYLSWLFDVVLNYVKHNVDGMAKLPCDTIDPRITELLAMTLGFKIKRKYDQKQLAALVSILPYVLRLKGSEAAVELVGNALVTASGASGEFKLNNIQSSNNRVNIIKEVEACLPKELIDTTLFLDLLPYILPAGITCKIVRKTSEPDRRTTKLYFDDSAIEAKWIADKQLAKIFNPTDANTEDKLSYANFLEGGVLNAGLMDNSIIATLDASVHDED